MLTNLALLLASVVLTVLAVETAIRTLGLFKRERAATDPSNAGFVEVSRDPEAPSADQPVTEFVLHPFQGWELRKAPGIYERLLELRESDFVIGVFGGSVAGVLANRNRETLIGYLEQRRPNLKGSIRVLTFGRGGYKQPQQTLFLTQAILHGIPLDVVVNIDGFNELAIGASDASTRGHHPLLPSWRHMTKVADLSSKLPTQAEIEITAKILALKRRIDQLRSTASGPYLQRSALVEAVLGGMVLQSEAAATELEIELSNLTRPATADTWLTLKDPCLKEEFNCWELITKIWFNSSRLMAAAVTEIDATYIHVLQPSQYVEGSKTLSPEELAHAYNPRVLWSRAARTGYPYLQRSGRELRQRGINFHDLTMLFRDHTESLYKDSCCHYNRRGNQLLAQELARLIDDALSSRENRSSETLSESS